MNERIKKLADNATHYANGVCDADPIPNWYETRDQKFAELIVRECMSIVDDAERGGSNEVWDNAVKFIRRDLKEHFGVKE